VKVIAPFNIINLPDVDNNIPLLQSNIRTIAFIVVNRGNNQFALPDAALNVPVIALQVAPLSTEYSNLTQVVPPATHSN
jgi:hypothetical protein